MQFPPCFFTCGCFIGRGMVKVVLLLDVLLHTFQGKTFIGPDKDSLEINSCKKKRKKRC